jgi:hypothetical protein
LVSAECSGGAVPASPRVPRTSSCGCLPVIPALLQFVLNLPGYRIVVVEANGTTQARLDQGRPSDLPGALQLGKAARSRSGSIRSACRAPQWIGRTSTRGRLTVTGGDRPVDGEPWSLGAGWRRPQPDATRRCGLKVGREVGVDLATAGDLNELGGLPLHASFLRSIDPVAPSPGRRRFNIDWQLSPISTNRKFLLPRSGALIVGTHVPPAPLFCRLG